MERSSAAKPRLAWLWRADGAEKIVLLRAKLGVGGGAGGDDAGDLAAHQFLGEFGVLHLVADGDLVALADELGDVSLGGVVGNSAHGDGNAIDLLARGEGDLELAGGGDRVIEEELVEVADAEKQQRGGMLFLDGGVLPHQRCGGFTHEEKLGSRKGEYSRANVLARSDAAGRQEALRWARADSNDPADYMRFLFDSGAW